MATEVIERVKQLMEPYGFETYPFKIGWYNDVVGDAFVFPYAYDTLGILVISTPDLFDKGLIPYILRTECPGTADSLDMCLKEHFEAIKKQFQEYDVEGMHDFEMLPSRRPKILVQTAGHVAGAAYYYKKSDVKPDAWDKTKNMYGVSIHPKYGGWFALRGALIFKNLKCPELEKKEPADIVNTREKKIELLERFNFQWQDWTYRDIIPVVKKYSELQKEYFATPPKDRQPLVDKIKREHAIK